MLGQVFQTTTIFRHSVSLPSDAGSRRTLRLSSTELRSHISTELRSTISTELAREILRSSSAQSTSTSAPHLRASHSAFYGDRWGAFFEHIYGVVARISTELSTNFRSRSPKILRSFLRTVLRLSCLRSCPYTHLYVILNQI